MLCLTFQILTDFATSKAICADPPPMSKEPTVLLRLTSDTLLFKTGEPVTQIYLYVKTFMPSSPLSKKKKKNVELPLCATVLFTNMQTLKFKSRLHNCVFHCRQS